MSAAAPAVHLVAAARAGDPVTATARALHHRLGGRLQALRPAEGLPDLLPMEVDRAGRVVVHTVDGGEGLGPALDRLDGRPLTVVHHGSGPASDRTVLRWLRSRTTHAVAADAAAREELRGLGFADVGTLPTDAVDGGLDGVRPHAGTAASLAAHPGRFVLAVGPLGPGRSLEVLIDAFREVLTGSHPAAVLLLCGPPTPAYLPTLQRRLLARGLVASEVSSPAADDEVLARLDRADVLVSLRPSGPDPFLRRAAQHGTPVVTTAPALVDGTGTPAVAVPARVGARELAAALARALDAPRTPQTAPPADPGCRTGELRARLGLR